MPGVEVLIVKLGPQDLLDGLVSELDSHPEIELVTAAPVPLDGAAEVIRAQDRLDVVLILGPDGDARKAAADLRDLHRSIHIVSVAIESGQTSVSFNYPSFEELGWIIAALGRAERTVPAEGKILAFRTGPIADDLPPRHTATPVSRKAGSAPEPVAVLLPGLDWVEKATSILLGAWKEARDATAGFGLSWDGLERWLDSFADLVTAPVAPVERTFADLDELLRAEAGSCTPLGRLHALLGHEPLSLKLLLVMVAGELDIRFQRLFGALHDDFGRRFPSLALACAIIAAAQPGARPIDVRAELAAVRRIRDLGLLGAAGEALPTGDEPLRLAPEIVDWLLGAGAEVLIGAAAAPIRRAVSDEVADLVPQARVRQVRAQVRRALACEGEPATAVVLGGSDPGWLAAEVAAIDRTALFVAPPEREIATAQVEALLARIVTAANLEQRRIVVDLLSPRTLATAFWQSFSEMLDRLDQPPFVLSSNPAGLLALASRQRIAVVDLPPPGEQERRQAVSSALVAQGETAPRIAAALVERLPIGLDSVPQAVSLAMASAAARGRPLRPEAVDWIAGFRRSAGSRLPTLARRIEPVPLSDAETEAQCASPLDRVVLPPTQGQQLRELVKHVRFGRMVLEEWGFSALLDGKGTAALFSGESGTGKTTAAHAVASELASDLYVIELSQVVSKYIGETEKNLDAVFDQAQSAGAVLLFDEADALFGKRSAVSDAHDRYANIEVAYLLQRMQRFAGLAILTTNNAANVDPAFARRLRFKIEFPRPSTGDRLLIWEQSIPPALRRRPDEIPLRELAFALDVTGGTIRQMAFHAAVAAAEQDGPIGIDEVLAGARSQLVRLGRFEDAGRLDAITAVERKRTVA